MTVEYYEYRNYRIAVIASGYWIADDGKEYSFDSVEKAQRRIDAWLEA